MTIHELRKLAKAYNCHVETKTQSGQIVTVIIKSPDYEREHEIRQAHLAYTKPQEIILKLEQLSKKKIADFWTGASEVKR